MSKHADTPWRAGFTAGGALGIWSDGCHSDDPDVCLVAAVPDERDIVNAGLIVARVNYAVERGVVPTVEEGESRDSRSLNENRCPYCGTGGNLPHDHSRGDSPPRCKTCGVALHAHPTQAEYEAHMRRIAEPGGPGDCKSCGGFSGAHHPGCSK